MEDSQFPIQFSALFHKDFKNKKCEKTKDFKDCCFFKYSNCDCININKKVMCMRVSKLNFLTDVSFLLCYLGAGKKPEFLDAGGEIEEPYRWAGKVFFLFKFLFLETRLSMYVLESWNLPNDALNVTHYFSALDICRGNTVSQNIILTLNENKQEASDSWVLIIQ